MQTENTSKHAILLNNKLCYLLWARKGKGTGKGDWKGERKEKDGEEGSKARFSKVRPH